MTCRAILRYVLPRRWRSSVAPFFLFPVLVMVTGCGSMIIRFGRMPDTSKLETSLQPGISTRADVLRVLGEPRNSGGAMLPLHDGPRDLWVYYYEEGSVTYAGSSFDDRRIFLFVFFKKDLYDGYIWFSSLPGIYPRSP